MTCNIGVMIGKPLLDRRLPNVVDWLKADAPTRRGLQRRDPPTGCRWRRDGGRVIPVGEKLGRMGLT